MDTRNPGKCRFKSSPLVAGGLNAAHGEPAMLDYRPIRLTPAINQHRWIWVELAVITNAARLSRPAGGRCPSWPGV